jgi:hypothetical protein
VARDPQALIFDAEVSDLAHDDPEGTLVLDALRRGLAEPLDLDHPWTIGDLLAKAFRAENLPEAGLWMALFACGWMPQPEEMHPLIAGMSEERAVQARDLAKRFSPGPRFGVDLQREPAVAAMMLMAIDRMMAAIPALRELAAA